MRDSSAVSPLRLEPPPRAAAREEVPNPEARLVTWELWLEHPALAALRFARTLLNDPGLRIDDLDDDIRRFLTTMSGVTGAPERWPIVESACAIARRAYEVTARAFGLTHKLHAGAPAERVRPTAARLVEAWRQVYGEPVVVYAAGGAVAPPAALAPLASCEVRPLRHDDPGLVELARRSFSRGVPALLATATGAALLVACAPDHGWIELRMQAGETRWKRLESIDLRGVALAAPPSESGTADR